MRGNWLWRRLILFPYVSLAVSITVHLVFMFGLAFGVLIRALGQNLKDRGLGGHFVAFDGVQACFAIVVSHS